MKPIETRYAGYHFRSRLEARWAVFFDSLGIRWEYEPQGYDLPAGPYLPDFLLHLDPDVIFEVKSETADQFDDRWQQLSEALQMEVIVAFGLPRGDLVWGGPADGGWMISLDEGRDNGRAFCICLKCYRIGITYEGRSGRLPCRQSCNPNSDEPFTAHEYPLVASYDAARSARFEFGHSGAS